LKAASKLLQNTKKQKKKRKGVESNEKGE